MIRIKLFILFVLICFVKSVAQDDNLDWELSSPDTVFILLSKKNMGRVAGKSSINPNKKYPEDMSRVYYFDNDFVAFNMYFTSKRIGLSFFVEKKKKFLKRKYITDNWFKDKNENEMIAFIDNKVLMMVDPTFTKGDSYYVIRVFRYAGEE